MSEVSREQKTLFCICCNDGYSRCSTRTGEVASAGRSTRESDYRKRKRSLFVCEQLGAAQKMPEENYSFKPTPDVRSFSQLVGHVADASYMFCSQASGEVNPMRDIEKTKTSKADLVAALKDAVTYCNKAFDSMTDAKGSQMVKLFNFDIAKLTVFSLNTAHTDEHYGNMVTYLRLKGIVPPTSENPPAQGRK
jgi:uncharacterized damage-inducible protein DinB